MQLPIISYGHALLKKTCQEVSLSDHHVVRFIEDLWETLAAADGVGLAAPQVNRNAKIFVVDHQKDSVGIREAFINPTILEYGEEMIDDEEACLSIPGIFATISRPSSIRIRYYNQYLQLQDRTFQGHTARIIQHEYDHVMGILYIDRLVGLKRMLLEKSLNKIKKGKIKTAYPMLYP